MKIAVIGAVGRMGSFFSTYFHEKGHKLSVYDTKTDPVERLASKLKARTCSSLEDAIKDAELIFVSTPPKETPLVLRNIGETNLSGKIVMEITSVKKLTREPMLAVASKGGRPVSIHPMFGPTAQSIDGRMIIVVPVSNGALEVEMAKKLFDKAEILEVDAEKHDELMGIILSLTHFVNLAFLSTISDVDIGYLRKFSGPTFRAQISIAESLLGDSVEMLHAVQTENDHSKEYETKFLKRAQDILDLIQSEDIESFKKFLEQVNLRMDEYHRFLGHPHDALYRLLNAIERKD